VASVFSYTMIAVLYICSCRGICRTRIYRLRPYMYMYM